MKIGILSMQRVINYGSILQAYALKQLLSEEKNIVEFIDIKPGKPSKNVYVEDIGSCKLVQKNIKERRYIKKIDRYFFKRLFHKFYFEIFMTKCQKKILELDKKSDFYDLIIIGSDEVFNCAQNAPWGFTLQLFGENLPAHRIITYAASCGFMTLDMLTKNEKIKIAEALKNISDLSVRDKNTQQFISVLTGKKAMIHLDPVLIYDFKQELCVKSRFNIKDRYLLIYAYKERLDKRNDILTIQNYAKKNHLKIYSVGGRHFWTDKHFYATPFEVLQLFQKATIVITDTFHGAVLSAKFNKQFVTIIRESNTNKLSDLLERLDLKNSQIQNLQDLEIKLKQKLDFTECNSTIEQGKKQVKKYFQKNCNEVLV